MKLLSKLKMVMVGVALVATSAFAQTTTVVPNPPLDRGWQLVRSTTNVGTPFSTEAACVTAARNDANTRKASANYRCVNTKTFRVEWEAAVAPAPTPTPTPTDPHAGHQGGNMPSYNPATVPVAAIGYNDWRLRTTGEMPYGGGDGVGAFRTLCTRSHFNRDDSLVYPGQPGRAHLHMYFGNVQSDANSTPQSLLASGNSTCRGGIANRSSYWVPAVIDTRDGTVIDMDRADVYYKTGYRGVQNSQIVPPPQGLRMIAGDMRRTTPFQWGPYEFRCNGLRDWGIPANCTSGELEIIINFPQCWNGRDLYLADQSHMAYANNGCPSTHPVAIPEISYVLHFVINGRNTSTWRLSSDNYVGGQGGYSMHGDWINGWNPALPPIWTTNVINRGLSGGSHILGDGQVMY